MATHSSSPTQDDFSAVPSFNSAVRPKQRPRGPDSSGSSGLGVHSSESVQLRSTGPEHTRSVENGAVDSATHANELRVASDSDSAGSAHKTIVETDFAELKDGTLVDLVQDPENPDCTLLAVWKDRGSALSGSIGTRRANPCAIATDERDVQATSAAHRGESL